MIPIYYSKADVGDLPPCLICGELYIKSPKNSLEPEGTIEEIIEDAIDEFFEGFVALEFLTGEEIERLNGYFSEKITEYDNDIVNSVFCGIHFDEVKNASKECSINCPDFPFVHEESNNILKHYGRRVEFPIISDEKYEKLMDEVYEDLPEEIKRKWDEEDAKDVQDIIEDGDKDSRGSI